MEIINVKITDVRLTMADKQRRINGKFASNIHDNPELLEGEHNG